MKKYIIIIVLVLSIFQMVVLATAIDIGSAAIKRAFSGPTTSTYIFKTNPANEDGKITSIEIYADATMSNVEVATFFNVSGNNFTTRDTHSIGTVTAGAKRTFTVNMDVHEGDYLGFHMTAGRFYWNATGGLGYWFYSGTDKIPCTNETFTLGSGTTYIYSIYGTGVTAEVGAEENAIFFGMAF